MARQRRGLAAPWPPGLRPRPRLRAVGSPLACLQKARPGVSHKPALSTTFPYSLHPVHGAGKGVDGWLFHETLDLMKTPKQLLGMSPRRARGRALAPWVEPARGGLQRPTGRRSIPHAGGRLRHPPRLRLTPWRAHGAGRHTGNSLFPPGGGTRRQAGSWWPLRGHGALAARRPLPISDRAQHRSPDFFAFSANAKPGPRQGALAFCGGYS